MILVIPAMIFALIAQGMVNSAFSRYSKVRARSGMTGEQVARALAHSNGLNVTVHEVKGTLSDHYDPVKKTINLSPEIYRGTSIAALSVAAHETGHAVQDKTGYGFLKLRHALVPITQIGSNMAIPLFIIGMLLSAGSSSSIGWFLMNLGIVFFTVAVAFQIITLPVEFNASSRARQMLVSEGYISGDEASGVKSMLNAAAMTYVAATAVAVFQLLRLLVIRGTNRDEGIKF